MLVLTRKNRESVVIGRTDEMQIVLEITVLEIEGGRVRLGLDDFAAAPLLRSGQSVAIDCLFAGRYTAVCPAFSRVICCDARF